ncbi:unnamed protein product [Rotaria sordida]|uniref:MULE transposase domain-containing protein n=1 Tax=Rotaria sordida TaxID=392033 RepID=A0A815ILC2_9BILA|nr:unnamed protein product [Rotaria sordida]
MQLKYIYNAGEAEASIGNECSKHYTNYTENGSVVYYRYNKAKRHGPQCAARIYLLYHSDSDKITVYKAEVEHNNHHDKLRGVDENVKQCIQELYNDGVMKPKQIIRALRARNYKKKKYGTSIISLGELKECIYEDDQDIEDDGENKFRIFISSIRSLNVAFTSSHIHANVTYKLVWLGYPVLIVGTTDVNKSFHPFGLAICSNEKTEDFEFISNNIQNGMQVINKDLLKPTALISDAADAIKNGFRNVFNNEYYQTMCWAHMKRKVEHCICQINDKDIRKEIMEDIEMLQLFNSIPVFKLASTLFMKKWNMNTKQQNQSILDFLEYFDNEWLQSNNGRYEGIQLYTSSTNSVLEATNETIKDDGTFRERHVLSRFLIIATNIINSWSAERDAFSINAKIFATETTLSLQLWTLSYQWAKPTKDISCIENNDSKQYYIPARDLQSVTRVDL